MNGVLVVGPAGSGKTTFCNELRKFILLQKKNVAFVNLDPASEESIFEPDIDIKNLIKSNEVIEELGLGPNGSLIFCMEYLLDNFSWLIKEIGYLGNISFLIFDFPGQIEITLNNSYLNDLIFQLEKILDINVNKFFLLDSQFITDISKYIGGILTSFISLITNDNIQFNLLSKIDNIKYCPKEIIDKFLNPCLNNLYFELNFLHGKNYKKLNYFILKLLEDFSLLKFTPLEISNVNHLSYIYKILVNNNENL